MSFHVSPPLEGVSLPRRAGEILSLRAADVVAEDVAPAAFDNDALAGAMPDRSLSLHLGHMGVVLAVSGQTLLPPSGGAARAGAEAVHFRFGDHDVVWDGDLADGMMAESRRGGTAGDPVVERLSSALARAERGGDALDGVCADALRLAIVARLLTSRTATPEEARPVAKPVAEPPRPKTGLIRWRLKRVEAYVDAHLGEAVTLADMAQAAGLSRMHFAAQFRIATGLRPHEYLLQRRIDKAREMLLETEEPVIQVALSVGFQTQAHFTTVFRRFVGDTPYRWRCANRGRH